MRSELRESVGGCAKRLEILSLACRFGVALMMFEGGSGCFELFLRPSDAWRPLCCQVDVTELPPPSAERLLYISSTSTSARDGTPMSCYQRHDHASMDLRTHDDGTDAYQSEKHSV